MANFAKEQLMKYGWTEGKGLGKNEDGMTEALKPALKFNNLGVGCSLMDSDQWWERTFNKVASNINVKTEDDTISISVSNENSTDIKKEENATSIYTNFRKTATLCNGHLVCENKSGREVQNEKSADTCFTMLTDEELFKACGGRTAHKGARHGLTLNGKLERIARQERALSGIHSNRNSNAIDDMLSSSNLSKMCQTDENTDRSVSKERKRMNKLANRLNRCSISEDTTVDKQPSGNSSKNSSKRKRDRDKKQCNDLTENNRYSVLADNADYETLSEKHEVYENMSKRLKVNDKHTTRENDATKHLTKQTKKNKKSNKESRDIRDQCNVKHISKTDEDISASSSKTKKFNKRRSRSLEDLCDTEKVTVVYNMCNTLQKTCKKEYEIPPHSKSFCDLGKGVKHEKNKSGNKDYVVNNEEYSLEPGFYEKITNEARGLNHKIAKKKKKKKERKLVKMMENLTYKDKDEQPNNNKKSNKSKQEKKLDTITEILMSVNLTEDVSEKVSKKTGKMKKQEKKLE